VRRLRARREVETRKRRQRIGQEASLDRAGAVEHAGPARLERALLDREPRHLQKEGLSFVGRCGEAGGGGPLRARAEEPEDRRELVAGKKHLLRRQRVLLVGRKALEPGRELRVRGRQGTPPRPLAAGEQARLDRAILAEPFGGPLDGGPEVVR